MKKSCIAVLTYRRLPALKAMLQGLQEHCSYYQIGLFEDCGMRDATSRFLAVGPPSPSAGLMATQHQFAPNITAFLGERNLGVAGNSNRAIKWFCDETDCDHLLLCNDDLFVLGDFPKFYRQAHEDLETGFFAFTDLFSPSHRWAICRCRGYRVRVFPRMTGIMISTLRRVIDKVGYFDTRFGKFGEEHSDFTNRVRFVHELQLDGQDQMCLDVEPSNPDGSAGPPLLKPQNVESSVTGEERKREDKIAVERMREASQRYATKDYFRPFSLVWNSHVGGVGPVGIPVEDIPLYKTVNSI